MGPNFDASRFGLQVNWSSWSLMSRHRVLVATSDVSATSQKFYLVATCLYHSLGLMSRQLNGVATSITKEERSRQQLEVATSVTIKEGRDISQLSRHQLQQKQVATSVSGRDINCEERRSRRHSEVATSAASKEGRNTI